MRLKPILFLTLFFFTLWVDGHPLKMTTAKLSYNQNIEKLALTINFFFDDFSSQIINIYHLDENELNINNQEFKDIVLDYVNNNIKIEMDSNTGILALESLKIIEENVLQVIFYVNNNKLQYFSIIKIFNKVLVESYNDQINILHLKLKPNDKTQIFRFDKNQTYKVFEVNFKK